MRNKEVLHIITFLYIGIAFNYWAACAEALQNEPNLDNNKQSLEQLNRLITEKIQVDNDQAVISKVDYLSKLSNDELRAEIYKEGLECFRREIDTYKWAFGIIIAIAGIVITIELYKFSNRVGKTEDKLEVNDLWHKAGVAHGIGHYEDAVEIWNQIFKKFKPNSRQFFNNWGSSLLNLAKQRKGNEKNKLLSEAAEKYKKAENFTRGIAAYNLSSIYALLNKKEECKEWLETAKETGRMLPKAKFKCDDAFENMRGEEWFKQFMNNLPE